MESFFILVAMFLLIVLPIGAICGMVAIAQGRAMRERLTRLENELSRLRQVTGPVQDKPTVAVAAETPASLPSLPAAVQTAEPVQQAPPAPLTAVVTSIPVEAAAAPSGPPTATQTEPAQAAARQSSAPARSNSPAPKPAAADSASLEMQAGTKWLGWAGVVMLVIGMGFLMKYAYDNDFIGPSGRLAIGVLTGLAALALGEGMRRRGYEVLFQTLTGGGLAILYVCVYFAFQVYHLAGSGAAFGCAVLVTLAAIALAVVHDAVAIAIVGVIGGFLSPILVSTGENHPHLLFPYLILLDLVAVGVAYFKRWRGLDLLAYAGTMLLYWAWYGEYFDESQNLAALLYTSLFYLLFLLLPVFHGLVRKKAEDVSAVLLISANAMLSLLSFYFILFQDFRPFLGLAVVAQALLVVGLFRIWTRRFPQASRTGETLLIVSLSLAVLAIPIALNFYAIPLAWAAEGVMLLLMGRRFGLPACRWFGLLALYLAGLGLFFELPLHRLAFLPVINVSFGSWVLVIAAISFGARLFYQSPRTKLEDNFGWFSLVVLASLLGCLLLTMETFLYWHLANLAVPEKRSIYRIGSLILLWSLLPLGIAGLINWRKLTKLVFVAFFAYGIGLLFCSVSLIDYPSTPNPLLFHFSFLAVAFFVASGWWGGRLIKPAVPLAGQFIEGVGHGVLVALSASELMRWSGHTTLISAEMGRGLVSAVWSVIAFALIWIGLVSRERSRRLLGFVLFGLASLKTILFDFQEPVFKIISFLAIGVLALAAAYFYKRFSTSLSGQASGRGKGHDGDS